MTNSSSSTLFCIPSIFNISSSESHRFNFSLSSRPVNLTLSLKSKTLRNSSPVVTFVSQTSNWAEEEEGEDGSIGGTSVTVDESFESEDGVGFPEPPEEAKLFVGNLPYDVDSQALAMLFEQAGTVEISEVYIANLCFLTFESKWLRKLELNFSVALLLLEKVSLVFRIHSLICLEGMILFHGSALKSGFIVYLA